MGVTQVTVTVRKPPQSQIGLGKGFSWSTQARSTRWCPGSTWKPSDSKPKGQRVYGARRWQRSQVGCHHRRHRSSWEDIVGSTIVFGEEDSEPLLGVTALESVGIEVDPRNQKLTRLPSTRLKGLPRYGGTIL